MRSVFLFLMALGLFSCHKKGEPTQMLTCGDRPPNDEMCAAHFERWFYNANSNACELIPYSGCESHGFLTKEECQVCPCTK